VPNISVILTSSSPRPLYLQKAGVPHLYFPPYTRSELISLVTSHPPPDLAPLSRTSADTATLRKLHLQFASIVYDSVVGPTASTSLPVFRSTCSKLWPRFIWPYISSEQPPGKARSWDFARLLVRNRALFQTEAEQILSERLGPRRGAWTFEELEAAATATATAALASAPDLPLTETTTAINSPTPATPPLLKHFSALLLISSYLASHTPPKLDILLFSRLSASSKSNRIRKSYHRRKLFQSPSSTAAAAASSAKTSRSSSTFDLKLNIPRPFSLERLLAIVRAIHPHGVPNQKSIADRVYRHLAELERLRLVVPAGGGAGAYDDDEKWRVNVNREWIEDIGRQWGIGLSEFEVGGS
jgi:origin recognition complex subunit 5